jgi:hypothetical protein
MLSASIGISDIEKQRLLAVVKCLLKDPISACVSAQLKLGASAGLKRPLKEKISKVFSVLPNRTTCAMQKAPLILFVSVLL